MKRHVVMVGRLVLAGYASAFCYVGEELLRVAGVFVATDEDLDTGDDEEDEDAEASVLLTGLDAERWVNDLRGDHHDPDAYADGTGPCGESDCRWCWVNATGAEG